MNKGFSYSKLQTPSFFSKSIASGNKKGNPGVLKWLLISFLVVIIVLAIISR